MAFKALALSHVKTVAQEPASLMKANFSLNLLGSAQISVVSGCDLSPTTKLWILLSTSIQLRLGSLRISLLHQSAHPRVFLEHSRPGLHAHMHLCCASPPNHIAFRPPLCQKVVGCRRYFPYLGTCEQAHWPLANLTQIQLISVLYDTAMNLLAYTHFKEPALAHASSMLTQVVVSGT